MKYVKVKKKQVLLISDPAQGSMNQSYNDDKSTVKSNIYLNSEEIPLRYRGVSASWSDPRYNQLSEKQKDEINKTLWSDVDKSIETFMTEGSKEVDKLAKAMKTMLESVSIKYAQKCDKVSEEIINKTFKKVLK